MAGIGRMITIRSVAIFPATLVYHMTVVLMQWVLTEKSQNPWIGEHPKIATPSCDTDQPPTRIMAAI
jgi:hypothetical protein